MITTTTDDQDKAERILEAYETQTDELTRLIARANKLAAYALAKGRR